MIGKEKIARGHVWEKPGTTENWGDLLTNLPYLSVLDFVTPTKKKLVNPYYIELENKKYWRLQPRENVISTDSIGERVLTPFMEYSRGSLEHHVQHWHI